MVIDDKVIDYKSTDHKAGQELFYHEEGEVSRVEVLDVLGDKEWERYKLKILEVVKESAIVKYTAS